MIAVALACCGTVALALSSVAPASSPSPEVRALTARFSRALSSVRSFRIVLTSPMGMSATVTMQTRERRMRTVMAIGPFETETIVAGGRSYVRTNGGPWLQDNTTSTTSVRAAGAGMMAQLMSGMHLRLLPDRRENGRLIGGYEIVTTPPPGAPASSRALTMTCTYDKATSLPMTCANAFVTETFGGWNDPKNRIDVPAVAASTSSTPSPIFFPSPTPAVSPPDESPTSPSMPSATPLPLPSASAPAT